MADALATLLLREGALSPEALERARERQESLGGALDTALLELGLLSEEQVAEALARASGLPAAAPTALRDPDPRCRRVFPGAVAERHRLAPFRLDGRELHLAAAWPPDHAALDEIGFMLSLALVPRVAPEVRVLELRRAVYGSPLPERYQALADALAPVPVPPRSPSAEETVPAAAADPMAAALAEAVRRAEVAPERPPEPSPPPAEPLPRPPRQDLATAREALAAAARRDDAVSAVLRYARDFFEHAALLAVSRERLQGRDALADDPRARQRALGVDVPIGVSGILRAVLDSGGPYLGPPGRDPAIDAVLRGLGRSGPRTILLYPVRVGDRMACLLWADNGEAPVSSQRVGDLLLLAGSLGGALERILVARKRPRAAGAAAGAEPAARPPFDPGIATRRLMTTERGSAERGRLVALLVQHGPEAAAELARVLPGPIDRGVAGREELVPVDDRGPVLMALAALGIVATPFLTAALGDPDPRRRRYAALLLGQSGDPAGLLPLADLAFDPDRTAGEAALGGLLRLRGHPDFGPVWERLRRALKEEPPRPALACRALVRLGDRGAVPALIRALSGPARDDAADALEVLTGGPFGSDAVAWAAWWEEGGGKGRAG